MNKREWLELGDGEVLNKLIVVAVLSLDEFNTLLQHDQSLAVEKLVSLGYRTVLITTARSMYYSKLPIETITEQLFAE